jgi:acyl carrier protein
MEATNSALIDSVRTFLAETFNVDPKEISDEAQLGELPQWDSMGHMDLMVGLESRFGVDINAETISKLISLPAIVEYLQAKNNA